MQQESQSGEVVIVNGKLSSLASTTLLSGSAVSTVATATAATSTSGSGFEVEFLLGLEGEEISTGIAG